jgi:phage terminase large subunit GpA-like protein
MKPSPATLPHTHWLLQIARMAAPPPDLTVSQWADLHRVLSSESSAEPGRWRTDRAAYQRGIQDALNAVDVRAIVVMKSAQIGASEVELNMLGFFVAHDPCPILYLQPTLEMAEAFSKDRIAPMLRDTACLTALVGDVKSRDAGNTLLHKKFPGGHLTLAGANSPASLASRPIRIVLADEVDRYPISAGTEGDPLSLAVKRTSTFHDAKVVCVSTPTVKGASRIEAAFKESDQRRYHVPCPHCAEFQVLVWGNVKWPPEKPQEAAYACPHCGGLWTEAERAAAIRAGEWRASAPFTGTAGFHISELYSPWRTLPEIAADFLAAKPYPERLRTWVNTSLGEVWETSATASVEPHALTARAEDYPLGTVPLGVGLVVAGVDVQGDRLELYVWGYGEGEEAWILDRQVLYGDPAHLVVWQQLLEQLDRPLTCANGAPVVPRVVAIDSGGLHTQTVYSVVKNNGMRRTPCGPQVLMAVKGQSRADAPLLGTPTTQEVTWKGQRMPGGVKLWPVGSHAAKQMIYGRLRLAAPGPGYVHFSRDLPEEVYEEITAERLVTKYLRGFGRLEWELTKGRRNEALDCAVYAYAAAVHAGVRRMRSADWTRMRERLHKTAAPAAAANGDTAPSSPAPETAQMPLPRAPARPGPDNSPTGQWRRPGNWINTWRR